MTDPGVTPIPFEAVPFLWSASLTSLWGLAQELSMSVLPPERWLESTGGELRWQV